MYDIGKTKNIALIGTILFFLGFIPYLGFLLSLAGSILLLIGMYNFSQVYNEKNIFVSFFIGWLVGIIAFVVGIGFGVGSLIPVLLTQGTEETVMAIFGLGIIVAILVFYAGCIFGCYHYKKSLDLLGRYTDVYLFGLAGNLLFWGAVGIIALGLGLLVIWVGWIILAVAFYSIPVPQSGTTVPPASAETPNS